LTTQPLLTPHQSQYFAWLLTRRAAGDSVESLAATLVDAQVDLNPHQVDAALFACRNPLARGVLLADEVGLGKTIEAGLVISQRWAERRRRILIVVPANLRKQWHQELQDKFGLHGLILEAKSYNAIRKQEQRNPFLFASGPIICSYQFAKAKADDVKGIDWDLVVLDEAHRLRNVYKPGNVIARTLRDALAPVHAKVLLTATPLQNSLLELYGLVSFIDDRVFGDLDSFRSQFTGREQSFSGLRDRLAPICKRTRRPSSSPSHGARRTTCWRPAGNAKARRAFAATASCSSTAPTATRLGDGSCLRQGWRSKRHAGHRPHHRLQDRRHPRRAGRALQGARHRHDRHRGRRRRHQPPVLLAGHQLRPAVEPAAHRAAHRPLPPLRPEARRGGGELRGPQQRGRPRVYELLAQKFQLFEGVFGASDEVLGAIGPASTSSGASPRSTRTAAARAKSKPASSNSSSTCPAKSTRRWSRRAKYCWRTSTRKCRRSSASAPRTL
jgi:hypothetical protein